MYDVVKALCDGVCMGVCVCEYAGHRVYGGARLLCLVFSTAIVLCILILYS